MLKFIIKELEAKHYKTMVFDNKYYETLFDVTSS